jgi:hypothetical protein
MTKADITCQKSQRINCSLDLSSVLYPNIFVLKQMKSWEGKETKGEGREAWEVGKKGRKGREVRKEEREGWEGRERGQGSMGSNRWGQAKRASTEH